MLQGADPRDEHRRRAQRRERPGGEEVQGGLRQRRGEGELGEAALRRTEARFAARARPHLLRVRSR